MRSIWAAAIAAALLLGGCDASLMSKKPLFEQGKTKLKAGLWVIEPKDCPGPSGAGIFDWPACAKPALVEKGEIRIFSGAGPVRLQLVSSDGMPMILQIAANKDRMSAGAADLYSDGAMDLPPPGPDSKKPEMAFAYLAFLPSPNDPVTRGMLMPLYCPGDDDRDPDIKRIPKPDKSQPDECEVTSARAVRHVAQQTASDWPKWQAIWIADQPYGPTEFDDVATNASEN
jgi:hypothetical protein